MPVIELNFSEKQAVESLKAYVSQVMVHLYLSTEARMMFIIEMNRMFKPEIEELRRRAEAAKVASPESQHNVSDGTEVGP
jgi:hypothetical protein